MVNKLLTYLQITLPLLGVQSLPKQPSPTSDEAKSIAAEHILRELGVLTDGKRPTSR